MDKNEYRVGVNRGLPVGMGYFSVSFGFGAMAVSQGVKTLDAVLLDAPCSGTGVMNEKPDVKYRVTEEGVQALCRTQKDILDAVAPMVKVGGTLVYSTCSILPQENEEQIRAFLERHPEYEIQPMGAELPEKLAAHENALGLQMFAHRDGTDGFYVCRLRRVKA